MASNRYTNINKQRAVSRRIKKETSRLGKMRDDLAERQSFAAATEEYDFGGMRNAMQDKLEMQEEGLLDAAGGESNRAYMQQLDRMSQSGGLRSGMGERAGLMASQQSMQARQGVRQQGALASLGIDEGIEGMKFDDTQQRQEMIMRKYEADRELKAAKASSKAQAKAACFLGGTQILMIDGSTQVIEDLDIGDETAIGGTIYGTGKSIGRNFYSYNDVILTAEHLVLDEGEWKRVKHAKSAKSLDLMYAKVYTVLNKDHILIANDTTFSDYEEVNNGDDLTTDERIYKKNELQKEL